VGLEALLEGLCNLGWQSFSLTLLLLDHHHFTKYFIKVREILIGGMEDSTKGVKAGCTVKLVFNLS